MLAGTGRRPRPASCISEDQIMASTQTSKSRSSPRKAPPVMARGKPAATPKTKKISVKSTKPVVGPQLWGNSFLPGIFQGCHIDNSKLDPRTVIQHVHNQYLPATAQRQQLWAQKTGKSAKTTKALWIPWSSRGAPGGTALRHNRGLDSRSTI